MKKMLQVVLLAGLTLGVFLPGTGLSAAGTESAPPGITKDDFENCRPADAMVRDEFKDGFWNLRIKTWGSPLLCAGDQWIKPCPDLTYDPKLNGTYNIYVETRAVPGTDKFGLKLTSDSDFTEIVVPNEKTTADYNYRVWIPWKKNFKMDGEKIVIKDLGRQLGEVIYIDSFKFEAVK